MVMVSAGGKEQGARVRALRHSQAQEFTVESFCGSKVRNVEMDVAQFRGRGKSCRRLGRKCGKQVVEIQRRSYHRNLVIVPLPLSTGTIRIKLDAISIRIVEVNRFTHSVIGRPRDRIARSDDAPVSLRKIFPRRVTQSQVIEPERSPRAPRRVALLA